MKPLGLSLAVVMGQGCVKLGLRHSAGAHHCMNMSASYGDLCNVTDRAVIKIKYNRHPFISS